jgi:hypothetical protein
MKPIEIKSRAQRELLEKIAAGDHAEARHRGMTVALAKASLEAHGGGKLPERLGPERPNRHGGRR